MTDPRVYKEELMGFTDIIIIAVIVLIVGAASFYIYRAKKSGKKCIGCPDSYSCSSNQKKKCSGSCGSCHGCGANEE